MSTDYDKQIEWARRAHHSVPAHLRNSPIILHSTPQPIYHQFKFRPQTEEDKQAQRQLENWYHENQPVFRLGDTHLVEAATKSLRWGFPYYGRLADEELLDMLVTETPYDQAWIHSPHHELTMEMLAQHIVPSNIGAGCPGEPVPLAVAMKHARERGHSIPDSYLTDQPPGEGEDSAYYAARNMIYRQKAQTGDWTTMDSRPAMRALTRKYAIPNPDYPTLTPYFVDQLWVMLERGPRVRLIAVEIDGERQQTPEQQAKERHRDHVLNQLGYEVFHVASWWCRIDPWRVIAEVFTASGIDPEASEQFARSGLRSIDDYVCAACNEPLIRWDDYWIVRNEDGEIMHDACHSY